MDVAASGDAAINAHRSALLANWAMTEVRPAARCSVRGEQSLLDGSNGTLGLDLSLAHRRSLRVSHLAGERQAARPRKSTAKNWQAGLVR